MVLFSNAEFIFVVVLTPLESIFEHVPVENKKIIKVFNICLNNLVKPNHLIKKSMHIKNVGFEKQVKMRTPPKKKKMNYFS